MGTCETTFDEVWAAGDRWQAVLRRRWWFIADVHAEMRASVWEQYRAGVVDQRELFAAASVAVRRMQRSEARHRHPLTILPPAHTPDSDVDALLNRVDAIRAVHAMHVPARAVPWARAVANATPTSTLSRRDSDRGRRWAKGVRAELGGAA